MALNNLERLAAQGDRAVFLRTARRAIRAPCHLLARLGGTSQFLADTLRRCPQLLAWLLEPRTMRQWLADELEARAGARASAPFTRPEARWNALRRFKYRQLAAHRLPRHPGRRRPHGDHRGAVAPGRRVPGRGVALGGGAARARSTARPSPPTARRTGLAVIGMGKLGGDELNYSSDIDLDLRVRRRRGDRGRRERVASPTARYFAEAARAIVAALESVTEEGHAFRVDLRLRPEGRSGALILSLDGYRRLLRRARRALGAPGPHQGARLRGRCRGGRALLRARRGPFVFRPGLDAGIVDEIRRMKQRDRPLAPRAKGGERTQRQARPRRHPRGGVPRPGAAAPLRGRRPVAARAATPCAPSSASPSAATSATPSGRFLGDALVYLRTVEHRLQILHEFQTHTLPEEPRALGLLARRMGVALPPRRRPPPLPRRVPARHRAVHRPSGTSSTRRRPPRATARRASRPSPRSRPPDSPIPIARARTSA